MPSTAVTPTSARDALRAGFPALVLAGDPGMVCFRRQGAEAVISAVGSVRSEDGTCSLCGGTVSAERLSSHLLGSRGGCPVMEDELAAWHERVPRLVAAPSGEIALIFRPMGDAKPRSFALTVRTLDTEVDWPGLVAEDVAIWAADGRAFTVRAAAGGLVRGTLTPSGLSLGPEL